MDKPKLIENIIILIQKYIPERDDLIYMIKSDVDCTKFILAEIDRNKKIDYSEEDKELIKEIAYYYL